MIIPAVWILLILCGPTQRVATASEVACREAAAAVECAVCVNMLVGVRA